MHYIALVPFHCITVHDIMLHCIPYIPCIPATHTIHTYVQTYVHTYNHTTYKHACIHTKCTTLFSASVTATAAATATAILLLLLPVLLLLLRRRLRLRLRLLLLLLLLLLRLLQLALHVLLLTYHMPVPKVQTSKPRRCTLSPKTEIANFTTGPLSRGLHTPQLLYAKSANVETHSPVKYQTLHVSKAYIDPPNPKLFWF